ncbi:MAG: two-component system response regulator RstA [Phenylobacterium sp.]|jgi:two-component system response regulator RstA
MNNNDDEDMQAQEQILLIDDDVELTDLIAKFLRNNGYIVGVEHSGDKAIDRILKDRPALVVLDLMLPGKDGLTICKEVRERFVGPIIMLTALDDDIDEVTGLEVGADDYLAKPIKPRVLLAHIRAQLRRLGMQVTRDDGAGCLFNEGRMRIEEEKRRVLMDNVEVVLTSAEYDLLWLLAQNAGKIISREALHKQIFRLDYDGIDRSIDLRVSRLRKKLEDDPKEPQLIKTVRNVGYLLAR